MTRINWEISMTIVTSRFYFQDLTAKLKIHTSNYSEGMMKFIPDHIYE